MQNQPTTETRTPPSGHTPIRTCVGCGQRRAAGELHRCVWRDEAIEVDRTGEGRGAWVCGSECLPAARQRRGFDRAWRHKVPPSAVDDLALRWEAAAPAAATNKTTTAEERLGNDPS